MVRPWKIKDGCGTIQIRENDGTRRPKAACDSRLDPDLGGGARIGKEDTVGTIGELRIGTGHCILVYVNVTFPYFENGTEVMLKNVLF